MMIDIARTFAEAFPEADTGRKRLGTYLQRGTRYAALQEALTAPDGTFPAIGRSITYRTGSLYLCTAGFLALGLPATDNFWNSGAAEYSSQKIWSGKNVPADHSI